MRIKELFTVPKGKKITEKVFGRVLLSSVCSILLCMICLAGTTWAWYTVDIENTGNVIEIATVTADVVIKQGENEVPKENGSYSLAADRTYSIAIELKNNATDFARPVYVWMTVAKEGKPTEYYCFAFNNEKKADSIEFAVGEIPAVVTFSVSWVTPTTIATLIGDEVAVIGEIPTEPTTEPSTEDTTVPTEETTKPTEEGTKPTEDTTPPEETTKPTEETTTPTGETTVPTEG